LTEKFMLEMHVGRNLLGKALLSTDEEEALSMGED